MNINKFFIDKLGANPKNPRWSWGAVDPITNRIFLRVWEDQIEATEDGERVRVASDIPHRKSSGFGERHQHLDQIRKGAKGFGIVCTAVDSETADIRKIKKFDPNTLLQFGALSKENGETYARIIARMPIDEIIRQQTAQSTLTDDLKSILKKKIEVTEKYALLHARVGQGLFRKQVLQLWGHCCAVTRSRTQDAIRASHIKAWRESTNEERLDPYNGLPLVASLDALFDAGLITFESSGKLIVSSKLSDLERQIFDIKEKSLTKTPTAKTAEYLEYHRKYIFRC